MGIPCYFSWLVSKMEDLILYTTFPHEYLEYLFLDMNGCIHPAVKKDPNMKEFEMYQAVCQYLLSILNATRPTKLVYIAIDGVAPKAKMDQQRIRRYKTIKEQQMLNELNLKYHKDIKSSITDFNMISPGTVFMSELSKALHIFVKTLKEQEPWKDVEFIISDTSEPGEGEHKIMNYIRLNLNKNKVKGTNTNIGIYGLDADLMFLTMCVQRTNIYLVRESFLFQSGKKPIRVENEYTYLDVDSLKNCLINILNTTTSFDDLKEIFNTFHYTEILSKQMIKQTEKNYQKLIMDYVYLSFFLGNDFLPSLSSFKIREGGLDVLIQAYKMTLWSTGEFLLSDDFESVNLNAFKKFAHYLSEIEDTLLLEMQGKKANRIRQFKYRTEILEDYEREIEEMNYVENKITNDTIKMGQEGWQARYYKTLFNISYRNKHEQITYIQDLCNKYLIGTVWVLKYYQGRLTDWRWSLNQEYGPSIKDIYQLLKNEEGFLSVSFQITTPVSPFCQLMAILPPESSKLLPKILGDLMTNRKASIHYMYPLTYRYNYINRKFLWECPLILPEIDLEKIENYVTYYQKYLTDEEKIRNTNKYRES